MSVHITIPTVDRDLARRLEPRAPASEARLREVRRRADAGIAVSVNGMPVLPGITDKSAMLRELVASEAEAGTDHLAACALRLRRASRGTYLPFVRETFPELAASYARAYGRAAYASDTYRDGLSTFMKRLCRQHGSGWREGRDDAFASVVCVVDAPVRATPWELPLSRAALAELS
jgi:DNA repair photolyase